MSARRWRLLVPVALLALAISLIWWRGPDWHLIRDTFAAVRWPWIIVAVANDSTSTIPKLSPPRAGETNTFAVSSSWVRTSFVTIPSTSIPASSNRILEWRRRYCSGSVPISRRRAPVARWISGQARSSTGRPLRVS